MIMYSSVDSNHLPWALAPFGRKNVGSNHLTSNPLPSDFEMDQGKPKKSISFCGDVEISRLDHIGDYCNHNHYYSPAQPSPEPKGLFSYNLFLNYIFYFLKIYLALLFVV